MEKKLKSKGSKKMKPSKGTKGMTGQNMTSMDKADLKGNKKAIKKAHKKLKNQNVHGRNY